MRHGSCQTCSLLYHIPCPAGLPAIWEKLHTRGSNRKVFFFYALHHNMAHLQKLHLHNVLFLPFTSKFLTCMLQLGFKAQTVTCFSVSLHFYLYVRRSKLFLGALARKSLGECSFWKFLKQCCLGHYVLNLPYASYLLALYISTKMNRCFYLKSHFLHR